MHAPNKIARLFLMYTLEQLSPAEEKELSDWRRQSQGNEIIFQFETDGKNIAQTIDEIQEKKEYIFQKIKEGYPGPWEEKPKTLWRRMSTPMRIAASVLLVVISTGIYLLFQGKNEIQPGSYGANLISTDGIDQILDDTRRAFNDGISGVMIERDSFGNLVYRPMNNTGAGMDKYYILYTPPGGYYNIRFPDGSLVLLNALSSIRYPANFIRDTIVVELKGEAYFEVKKKDTLHPFFVVVKPDPSAPRMSGKNKRGLQQLFELEVSRGRFNINAYGDESFVTATMLQGNATIRSDPDRSHSGIQISSGERVMLADQTALSTDPADISEAVAWKNGRIFYKHAGISVIMNAISRWYRVSIVYHDSIPEGSFHIDLPRDASIHQVLRSLRQQGLYCDIEVRKINVRNKPK